MRAAEFCYWLQGYFEIGDANDDAKKVLGQAATECIRRHISLVKKVDPEHDTVLIGWLDMKLVAARGNTLPAEDVAEIRRHLASQFKHVIDPSYGGNASELQAIHDAKPTRPQFGGVGLGGTLYRC